MNQPCPIEHRAHMSHWSDELVLNVLGRLPIQDLLSASQVCRQWARCGREVRFERDPFWQELKGSKSWSDETYPRLAAGVRQPNQVPVERYGVPKSYRLPDLGRASHEPPPPRAEVLGMICHEQRRWIKVAWHQPRPCYVERDNQWDLCWMAPGSVNADASRAVHEIIDLQSRERVPLGLDRVLSAGQPLDPQDLVSAGGRLWAAAACVRYSDWYKERDWYDKDPIWFGVVVWDALTSQEVTWLGGLPASQEECAQPVEPADTHQVDRGFHLFSVEGALIVTRPTTHRERGTQGIELVRLDGEVLKRYDSIRSTRRVSSHSLIVSHTGGVDLLELSREGVTTSQLSDQRLSCHRLGAGHLFAHQAREEKLVLFDLQSKRSAELALTVTPCFVRLEEEEVVIFGWRHERGLVYREVRYRLEDPTVVSERPFKSRTDQRCVLTPDGLRSYFSGRRSYPASPFPRNQSASSWWNWGNCSIGLRGEVSAPLTIDDDGTVRNDGRWERLLYRSEGAAWVEVEGDVYLVTARKDEVVAAKVTGDLLPDPPMENRGSSRRTLFLALAGVVLIAAGIALFQNKISIWRPR